MRRFGLFISLLALSLFIHSVSAVPDSTERLVVFEAFMRET
jgi:hypothetical protein